MGMAFVSLFVFMSPVHADDSILESHLADCAAKQDGHCFLRMAAFEEAAAAFEASPTLLNKAAAIRAELGQVEKAYDDAVAFVRASHDARATAALAVEVLSLGESIATTEFYERYLKDFKDHAPADALIVAHAKLGSLYMKASCPIQSFHGGCVEVWQEPRKCPQLNEGPYQPRHQPRPMFPAHRGNGTTYFATVTKVHPRDKRLLALATKHLRAALNARDLFWAEQTAMPVPSRLRVLANARGEATLQIATLDLDRFLGMGGLPETLDFSLPTQFDSPCKAERKRRTFEYSQKKFLRWLIEKSENYTKILSPYREAIVRGGPESVVVATARFAYVMGAFGDALLKPNTQFLACAPAGFHEPPSYPFDDNARLAAQACLHLANSYPLTTPASQYCRFLANQVPTHEGDAIHELFPSDGFLSIARDTSDDTPFGLRTLDTPPKAKPKPPRFACTKTHKESFGPGVLGRLKMHEGSEFAKVFARTVPFPDTFPAELAKRFPVIVAD